MDLQFDVFLINQIQQKVGLDPLCIIGSHLENQANYLFSKEVIFHTSNSGLSAHLVI